MPRYNVMNSNGDWACFSSITDSFVTEFMPKDEYEQWRKFEYGESDYKPAEECNMMTLENCLLAISANRSDKQICDHLREVGIFEKQ